MEAMHYGFSGQNIELKNSKQWRKNLRNFQNVYTFYQNIQSGVCSREREYKRNSLLKDIGSVLRAPHSHRVINKYLKFIYSLPFGRQ